MTLTPVTIGVPYRDEGQSLSLLTGGLAGALAALPPEQQREVIICVNGSREGFHEELSTRLRETHLDVHAPRVVTSDEGKLAAQKAIVSARRLHGFIAFVDSDVVLESNVLRLLCEALESDPGCMVAYGQPVPIFPTDPSVIHHLLRVHYSLRDHAYRRPYFHGRTFMIREWFFEEPQPRTNLPASVVRRLRLDRGPIVDDIAMSRMAVTRWGPDVVREVAAANVYFDPPDTLGGLYAGALRVALEVRRLDALYPHHAHLQARMFNSPWRLDKLRRFSRRLRAAHALWRLLDSRLKRLAFVHAWMIEAGFLDLTTLWRRVPGTKSFPRIRRAWRAFHR